MKRLLDVGDVSSIFHQDGDRTYIQRVQDVEPILDRNKRLQNHDDGFGTSELKRIASIPLVVAEKWVNEDGINWMALPKKEKMAYLRRKLNSPDYRYLRTSTGVF